jgi:hypothetical protein
MNMILFSTHDFTKAGEGKTIRFASTATIYGDSDQRGDTLHRMKSESVSDFMIRVRGRIAELE